MDRTRYSWANTNYFDAWRLIVGGSVESEILEFDGLLLADCGQPFAFMNLAFVRRPLRSPEETLARAIAHYEQRQLPAILCVPPGSDDATEDAVARRGLEPAPPHPGMTLFPIGIPGECPADLEIREITQDGELEQFQATAETAFNMPYSLPQRLLTPRFRDHPAVHMFVGLAAGRPVSTSCLVVTGRVAGLYFVSTLPAYRGRGFATAISWHAIARGVALGCDMATLQASPLGRPIYLKMGFAVTSDFRRFHLTSAA